MWCNEKGKLLLSIYNTIQRDEELEVGRSNFELARLLPLHRLSPLSDLRSRGFKMLILSTLKPWGASWTSEAHLSWVSCHSIIKQTGRTSPNAFANLPTNDPIAHTHVDTQALHQHPPQASAFGNTEGACKHTLNVVCSLSVCIQCVWSGAISHSDWTCELMNQQILTCNEPWYKVKQTY